MTYTDANFLNQFETHIPKTKTTPPNGKTDIYVDEKVVPGRTDVLLLDKEVLIPSPNNRPLSESRIRWLRKHWQDHLAGVMEVRPYAGRPGFFEVIIGNHRRVSAEALPYVSVMWAKIHYNMSDEEAAELWRSEAKDRKNPTAPDLFWNAIRSGDDASIAIKGLIHTIGREAARTKTSNQTNVACLATLPVLYKKDRHALERIFPVLGEVCRGEIFQEMIVRGLFALEIRLMNGSFSQPHWGERLIRMGYTQIINAMNERNQHRGGHNEKQWAEAILILINKGLRNKLIARGLNDFDEQHT